MVVDISSYIPVRQNNYRQYNYPNSDYPFRHILLHITGLLTFSRMY